MNQIEEDLSQRYAMDTKVWRKTLRSSFMYSTPLEVIVGLPLFLPLVYILVDRGLKDSYFFTILQTVAVSFFAFYASDKLIETFKETLEKKGLFGRDLNKAGEQ